MWLSSLALNCLHPNVIAVSVHSSQYALQFYVRSDTCVQADVSVTIKQCDMQRVWMQRSIGSWQLIVMKMESICKAKPRVNACDLPYRQLRR